MLYRFVVEVKGAVEVSELQADIRSQHNEEAKEAELVEINSLIHEAVDAFEDAIQWILLTEFL